MGVPMIDKITDWLLELIVKVFKGLWDFVKDQAISILEGMLEAVVALVSLIPAPEFLTQYSLGSLMADFPPYVWYFVGNLKLTEAFAILASGFAFRMTRKAITLGQW
jgi:hypothetical protein